MSKLPVRLACPLGLSVHRFQTTMLCDIKHTHTLTCAYTHSQKNHFIRNGNDGKKRNKAHSVVSPCSRAPPCEFNLVFTAEKAEDVFNGTNKQIGICFTYQKN